MAAHTVWTCTALDCERREADKLLAECEGEKHLPKAVLHGIAPAMVADAGGAFFGGLLPDRWAKETLRLFGKGVGKVSFRAKTILDQFEKQTVAREIRQYVKRAEQLEEAPCHVDGKNHRRIK